MCPGLFVRWIQQLFSYHYPWQLSVWILYLFYYNLLLYHLYDCWIKLYCNKCKLCQQKMSLCCVNVMSFAYLADLQLPCHLVLIFLIFLTGICISHLYYQTFFSQVLDIIRDLIFHWTHLSVCATLRFCEEESDRVWVFFSNACFLDVVLFPQRVLFILQQIKLTE